jgi:enoyl-CoA hydratase
MSGMADTEATGEDPVVREHLAPHVTAIRLNRPDRLNALSFPMTVALHDALDAVATDDDCKVVVLTGAGRGFCAGLDLRDFGRPPAPGTHPWMPAGRTGQAFMSDLTRHLRATPQIVIAAINGVAYGGGLAITLACDLRVASSAARLCAAFIRTGLTGTDIGISYFLPRLIGASRAFDLMVTGRTVDAAEAERMGIVSQVYDPASFPADVTALASGIAGYTKYGLRNTKEVMWHNLDAASVDAAIAIENRNQDLGNVNPEVRQYMSDYASRFAKK